MVSDCGVEPQDSKLGGETDIVIIVGELLVVLITMRPVAGLQVKLSVALPEPASAVKDIRSGSAAQVTFGVVGVAVFKITVE